MAAGSINKEPFIEPVKKLPCLYDISRKDYKDEAVRENAWKKVCLETSHKQYNNEKELTDDIQLVHKTFKNLRDRMMNIRKEFKPSGSAGGSLIEPSWPYYKLLSYLVPCIKYRETMDNFVAQANTPTDIGETTNVDLALNLAEEEINEMPNESSFMVIGLNEEEFGLYSPVGSLSIESAISRNANSQITSPAVSISSEGTHPKRSKRSRYDNTQDNSRYLMKTMERTSDFISKESKREEPDEDDLLGQSIGKQMKALSRYQKSLAKLKIQQVMHEVRWSTQEQ